MARRRDGGGGRPMGPIDDSKPWHMVLVRMRPPQYRHLRELADREGCFAGELVRDAVNEYLERRGKELVAS